MTILIYLLDLLVRKLWVFIFSASLLFHYID